jgi:hypothetical protein
MSPPLRTCLEPTGLGQVLFFGEKAVRFQLLRQVVAKLSLIGSWQLHRFGGRLAMGCHVLHVA